MLSLNLQRRQTGSKIPCNPSNITRQLGELNMIFG